MVKRGGKFKLVVFLICLAAVYLVSFIGGKFTSSSVNSLWYQSIKPEITPPAYVFPIAWLILFFLIALSMYFAYVSGKKRKMVISLFAINLLLNMAWTFFYFQMRNPALAFIEIILLWFSIVLLVFALRKVSKKSSWLLIPYLLWVAFAGILNYLSLNI